MKSFAYRIAEQMRQPSGLLGKVAASHMKKYNLTSIKWTLDRLGIDVNDHVLEIGFGPGEGIKEVLPRLGSGSIDGIDISEEMIRMASRTNAEGIATGKVRLQKGDANNLPYKSNEFDKVFAVNVFYFWKDPKIVLAEIRRTLKPNGQVALFLVSKEDLLRMKPSRTDVFKGYTEVELVRSFQRDWAEGL